MNTTRDIEAIYPASPLQQAMLLNSQLAPGSGVYVLQLSFDIRGRLDTGALRAAWDDVITRHAVHRTLFAHIDRDQPLQVVRRDVDLPWREEDWSALPAPEQRDRFESLLADDRATDFDPARAPLMRCVLIRLADRCHRFLWTRHHAVSDGWSMPVVMAEVLNGYRCRVEGGTMPPGPATQYREYIAWLRDQDEAEAEKYWRGALAGVQGPTPLGVGRPPVVGYPAPRTVAKRRVALPTRTTAALQAAARRERLTLSTYAQGAWAILLRRYGGEPHVMFGMIASGRPPSLPGAEAMVGPFLNTLPAPVQVDDGAPVADWLRALQSAQVEREEFGYAPLSRIRRWAQLPGDVPLFESLVAFENFPLGTELSSNPGTFEVENVHMAEQTSFPLTLTVAPGDPMTVQIAYDEDRFAPDTVARMLDHYEVILTVLADAPGRIRDLPVLTEDERRRVLVDWNTDGGTEGSQEPADTGDIPAERTPPRGVHQLFEAQAVRTPDATALIVGEDRLTYRELDARAEHLAARLRRAGVTPGAFVGVCLDREADLPATLLATLKAGAAYVPLDPAYPLSRIEQILGDAEPVVVLAQETTREVLARSSARLLLVDADGNPQEAGVPSAPAGTPVHEQSVALVIYTSGSTGRPKGVRITHGNVVALLTWAQGVFSREELAGTLASTSICFDLSVFELFLPLSVGATVILAGNALLLPSLPARESVTLVNTVPSAIDTLLRVGELPSGVRVVNLAGEPLPRDLADRLYARDGIRKVYDLYGPSEDTVYSTFAIVPEHGDKPLIGRAVAGSRAYVLDDHMNPVPVGIAGELYLGGEGVAQGYHARPSLTAERFVPDPYGSRPGGRLFRTGDLARWHPHGELEYLGRNDRQVKLRGFRIELGEIEAALRRLPGTREAVVVVHEDQPGARRLVAYVVAEGAAAFDGGEAARTLQATLPDYMVPAAFVALPTVPLTPNGKVDWTALPSPEPARARRPHRAPRTGAEKTIAAIWSEILGVERPGTDEGFFDLGGDSLLLARVFGRVKVAFPGKVVMTDLYQHPTISALARHLTQAEKTPAFGSVQSRLDRRRAARDGGKR
ncbi:non-ribosomal peptide synthetase [Streptomyces paromomycinus]|uniref:Non-ribosomal peptide synthetase n=1 Tax=Streptomyces paromomycinus TaxID=92743 RepID=A0A401VUP9_STREY|nr:non-ribosomal peptide synthetase [Streptomyces paromomycinus]GCD40789.1 non-ribosomal peptide synthetase [Streptomyces paromomycinus]